MHINQERFVNSAIGIINQIALKLTEASSKNAENHVLRNFVRISDKDLKETVIFLSYFFLTPSI